MNIVDRWQEAIETLDYAKEQRDRAECLARNVEFTPYHEAQCRARAVPPARHLCALANKNLESLRNRWMKYQANI